MSQVYSEEEYMVIACSKGIKLCLFVLVVYHPGSSLEFFPDYLKV